MAGEDVDGGGYRGYLRRLMVKKGRQTNWQVVVDDGDTQGE